MGLGALSAMGMECPSLAGAVIMRPTVTVSQRTLSCSAFHPSRPAESGSMDVCLGKAVVLARKLGPNRARTDSSPVKAWDSAA